jgi:Tfp pilus assembly protein FimT
MTNRAHPEIHDNRDGFSMLEVMAVTAISMIVTMIALPNMVNGIGMIRMRSSMTSLAGVLQNCRILAVKQNLLMSTHFSVTTSGGANGVLAYVKKASDPNPSLTTDSQVQLEQPITQVTTPSGSGAPSALDSTSLGFTPQTSDPTFTPTGLPCVYSTSTGTCATNNGFVYYFHDARPAPQTGWGAISISPAGRMKKWFWSGSAWTN